MGRTFFKKHKVAVFNNEAKNQVAMGFVKQNTDHPVYSIFGIDPSLMVEVEMTNNGSSDSSSDEGDGSIH